MAASALQKTQFITDARAAMTRLLEASADCRHLVEVGTDLGVLSGGGVLVDADFINANAGILAADFLAAGGVANTALSAGNRQTITKVKI